VIKLISWRIEEVYLIFFYFLHYVLIKSKIILLISHLLFYKVSKDELLAISSQ